MLITRIHWNKPTQIRDIYGNRKFYEIIVGIVDIVVVVVAVVVVVVVVVVMVVVISGRGEGDGCQSEVPVRGPALFI